MPLIASVGGSAHETRTVSATKAGAKRGNERLMDALPLWKRPGGIQPAHATRGWGGHSVSDYDVAVSDDRSTCVCTPFYATMKKPRTPNIAAKQPGLMTCFF